jgi:hypothetical protein
MKRFPFFPTTHAKGGTGKIAGVDSVFYRYLLGEMSPPERDALEDRYFQDNALHEKILAAEDDLIDAYVSRELTSDQRARFKEFFLRSDERVGKLRVAEALTQQGNRNSECSSAVAHPRKKGGGTRKNASPVYRAGIALGVFGVGAVVIGVLSLSEPGGGSAAFRSVSFETGKKPGMIQRAGDTLGDWLSGIAQMTLQHEFKDGVLQGGPDWTNQTLSAGLDRSDDPRDWSGETNKSASLRLWKKSTAMENYRMEFQGRLERTSLSWAVRAADSKNFYGTRLAIIKTGPLMNAALIRFTVIDDKEVDRTLNQLPLRLERGTNYRITVTAQGDQINTYLNGQFIGRLTDKRLTRGGVGFFDDANDPQKIAWVTVSTHDNFLDRVLAHFALFVMLGRS